MRGRPSRKEENATFRIAARLTKDELEILEKNREYMDMSKSDFIREAILYYSNVIDQKKVANA